MNEGRYQMNEARQSGGGEKGKQERKGERKGRKRAREKTTNVKERSEKIKVR